MKIKANTTLNAEFLRDLQGRFAETLPGASAWQPLMPAGRSLDVLAGLSPVESAVLLLFVPIDASLFLLFIRRSEDGRIHGGQIGFPGGRTEPSDTDFSHTALREAGEETGIDASAIHLLGKLTPLYIPHSNFRVHPFVGYTLNRPIFHRQTEEVDEILLIPFAKFYSPASLTHDTFTTLRGKTEAPCFKIEDIKIWGATAMILNELISIIPVEKVKHKKGGSMLRIK